MLLRGKVWEKVVVRSEVYDIPGVPLEYLSVVLLGIFAQIYFST